MATVAHTLPARRSRADTVLGRLYATLAVALPVFGRWLVRSVPKARQAVLYAAGLGGLSYAAWQWSHVAGWAAFGVSCLIFEWLSSD